MLEDIQYSVRTLYHISPEENEESILSNGLIYTDASECDSGRGIHICKTIMGAHSWIGQIRNERDMFDRTFTIFEVSVDEDTICVVDKFDGVGPDDAYVLCKDRIPPENVESVEWVY